ncbi:hypothetical protein AGMMS50212_13490 [Spirochaetia bacterium]|nr:hypothetical protein AGMMS50212_13490 [Spirochaetia bacterium]
MEKTERKVTDRAAPYIAKTLKLLERNHVTISDIAKYNRVDVETARRIITTLSLNHAVYEIYENRPGIYGILPKSL